MIEKVYVVEWHTDDDEAWTAFDTLDKATSFCSETLGYTMDALSLAQLAEREGMTVKEAAEQAITFLPTWVNIAGKADITICEYNEQSAGQRAWRMYVNKIEEQEEAA